MQQLSELIQKIVRENPACVDCGIAPVLIPSRRPAGTTLGLCQQRCPSLLQVRGASSQLAGPGRERDKGAVQRVDAYRAAVPPQWGQRGLRLFSEQVRDTCGAVHDQVPHQGGRLLSAQGNFAVLPCVARGPSFRRGLLAPSACGIRRQGTGHSSRPATVPTRRDNRAP